MKPDGNTWGIITSLRLIFISLILGWVSAGVLFPSQAGTTVCGAVCDETWTSAGNPYQVTCNVTVASGCTLTVESGVDVRVVPQATDIQFVVQGVLDVNGTAGSPVVFTSDSLTPATGDWYGLGITGTGSATIENLTVSYGNFGIYVYDTASLSLAGATLSYNLYDGLYLRQQASATFSGVSSHHNSRSGLYIYSSGSGTVLSAQGSSSSITNNTQYGVFVQRYTGDNPQVQITGSSIYSNAGSYDFYTTGATTTDRTVINATGNYWGTTDAAQIATRIYDYSDSVASPIVDRCGFLNGPGGTPYHDGYCPDPAICDESVSWNLTDKPYFLEQIAVVCPTGTLTVGPGVTVLAEGGSPTKLTVAGTLDVNGTTSSPVLFSSALASPAAGNWYGISVIGTGSCFLDQTTLRFATYSLYATDTTSLALGGVTISNAKYDGLDLEEMSSATLHQVTSQNNGRYGLYVYSYGSAPTVSLNATECSFTGNTSDGVYIQHYYGPDPQVSITSSSIHSNGGSYDLRTSGVETPDTTVVTATNNWWGTTDASQIAARIYDYSDTASSPIVDRCGYLDGPGGVPARDGYCPDPTICGETATWNLTDKPYFLEQPVSVCPSGRLEIGPDVEVLAEGGSSTRITVAGVLDVNGTTASPVLFSSALASPAPGNWYGITLTGTGSASLDEAGVAYAVYPISAGDTTSLTLTGVTLTSAQSDGLYLY